MNTIWKGRGILQNQYPDWVQDQSMRDYYDQKWGVPVRDEREMFMMLTLETFQAGLSWKIIWQRQAAFKNAFANFDVAKIADFDGEEVDRLLADEGIIRNRRKILATIHNAQVLNKYHQEGKTLVHFLWSFVDNQPVQLHAHQGTRLPNYTPLAERISRQLKRAGFQFVGPTTVFSLLCAVGIVNGRVEE